jgi:hypothetical protein
VFGTTTALVRSLRCAHGRLWAPAMHRVHCIAVTTGRVLLCLCFAAHIITLLVLWKGHVHLRSTVSPCVVEPRGLCNTDSILVNCCH